MGKWSESAAASHQTSSEPRRLGPIRSKFKEPEEKIKTGLKSQSGGISPRVTNATKREVTEVKCQKREVEE